MRLGAEYPGMAPVHGASLSALEHELVRAGILLRVGAQLLFRQVQRHDRSLPCDTIRRLELMQVRWRQDIPVDMLAGT